MRHALLVVGGVLTCALAASLVWPGVQIHTMAGFAPRQRALMEMRNAGRMLTVILSAGASPGFAGDVLSTRLGALVFAVCVAIAGIHPVRPGDRFRCPAGSVAG